MGNGKYVIIMLVGELHGVGAWFEVLEFPLIYPGAWKVTCATILDIVEDACLKLSQYSSLISIGIFMSFGQ